MTTAVEQALKEEIQERVAQSREYVTKIETAKTEYKKKYYRKKLRLNNEMVASLLEGYERVVENNKKEQNDEALAEPESTTGTE
jgi:hypothetical protein